MSTPTLTRSRSGAHGQMEEDFDLGQKVALACVRQQRIAIGKRPMKENDFQSLCESIRQAGEIGRGQRKPSRTFPNENPDPKVIRERLGLSQSRFAAIIGVSVRTLQNWEQGRREPEGPAKALLRVVDREPQAVLQALHA